MSRRRLPRDIADFAAWATPPRWRRRLAWAFMSICWAIIITMALRYILGVY